MARRYIGDATVSISYVGTDSTGKDAYEGAVSAKGRFWRFSRLYAPAIGFRVAYDSPAAYDAMASSAVGFGSYYTSDNRPDPGEGDLPGYPDAETADAISEATSFAMTDGGSYMVRRSPNGPERDGRL